MLLIWKFLLRLKAEGKAIILANKAYIYFPPTNHETKLAGIKYTEQSKMTHGDKQMSD